MSSIPLSEYIYASLHPAPCIMLSPQHAMLRSGISSSNTVLLVLDSRIILSLLDTMYVHCVLFNVILEFFSEHPVKNRLNNIVLIFNKAKSFFFIRTPPIL